jgi:hypothetical protein
VLTKPSALYDLHEPSRASANENENRQDGPSLSELALEYTTRIVIDVARAFNANFSSFNMTAIPPGYTNIIFRAALQHIRSSSQVGSSQWLSDLESLRKALWFFKHRWKISGKQPNSDLGNFYDTNFVFLRGLPRGN